MNPFFERFLSGRFWLQALRIAAMAGGLAGCDSQIDFRNAEIVNGKIYKRGADKPFSGRVTNVPESTILSSRKDYQPYGLLMGTVYQQLGIVIPNPQAFCDANSDDGVLDGKTVCSGGTGQVRKYEMKFNDGTLDGAFKSFNVAKDGALLIEATFNKGVLDGDYKMYGPTTGAVIFHLLWKDGKPEGVEEKFDDPTGKLVSRATYKNGLLHGEVVGYRRGTDQMTARVHYSEGLTDGIEETWDGYSGKLLERREWKMGKPHGDRVIGVHENGLLTDATVLLARYDNGVEVPLIPLAKEAPVLAGPSTCVDQWTAAFHKEQGEDAMITADQLGEWQTSCHAGKSPGWTSPFEASSRRLFYGRQHTVDDSPFCSIRVC